MASVKAEALPKAMRYEQTGTKDIKDVHGVAIKMAESLTTSRLVWLLVKRHKVGLLAIGNIVLVLNWAFPAWTSFVASLFQR